MHMHMHRLVPAGWIKLSDASRLLSFAALHLSPLERRKILERADRFSDGRLVRAEFMEACIASLWHSPLWQVEMAMLNFSDSRNMFSRRFQHRWRRAARRVDSAARMLPVVYTALLIVLFELDLSDRYLEDDQLPMFEGPGPISLSVGGVLTILVLPCTWLILVLAGHVARRVAISKKVISRSLKAPLDPRHKARQSFLYIQAALRLSQQQSSIDALTPRRLFGLRGSSFRNASRSSSTPSVAISVATSPKAQNPPRVPSPGPIVPKQDVGRRSATARDPSPRDPLPHLTIRSDPIRPDPARSGAGGAEGGPPHAAHPPTHPTARQRVSARLLQSSRLSMGSAPATSAPSVLEVAVQLHAPAGGGAGGTDDDSDQVEELLNEDVSHTPRLSSAEL